MRAERIVQRHSQRDQLANLKTMMRESKPLIEADKQLRKAYMAGYRRRVEEEIAESKAQADLKEQNLTSCTDPAKVDELINQELGPQEEVQEWPTSVAEELKSVPSELEQKQNNVQRLFEESLKPSHDTQDQGTTKTDEQSPVG